MGCRLMRWLCGWRSATTLSPPSPSQVRNPWQYCLKALDAGAVNGFWAACSNCPAACTYIALKADRDQQTAPCVRLLAPHLKDRSGLPAAEAVYIQLGSDPYSLLDQGVEAAVKLSGSPCWHCLGQQGRCWGDAQEHGFSVGCSSSA